MTARVASRGGAVSAEDRSDVAVAVIAKEPVAGRVKTRLSPPCSSVQAACVAEAALVDTLAAVQAARVARRVVVLDGEVGDWLPEGFDVVPQVTGNLGDRLAAAFAAIGGPVIVVGMDTPQLGPTSIEAAADSLCVEGVDAVLGRALDGGYWTIGFRRRVHGAFTGVPMSADDTADQQLSRLRKLELSVAEIHTLRDIDRWEDALAVARDHPDLITAAAVGAVSPRVGS
jgi:rSAM/selenodomain-associated transferase 1